MTALTLAQDATNATAESGGAVLLVGFILVGAIAVVAARAFRRRRG